MGLDALLENQLGDWPKFQKLHIHSLSKFRLFALYGQQVLKYGLISKIAIFGHETWAKSQKLHIYFLLYTHRTRVSKLGLFLIYGQRFLRYGPIFKIAIVGHATFHIFSHIAHILRKLPPSPHILPKLPSNFTPFYSMATHFQDIDNFYFPSGTVLNYKLLK